MRINNAIHNIIPCLNIFKNLTNSALVDYYKNLPDILPYMTEIMSPIRYLTPLIAPQITESENDEIEDKKSVDCKPEPPIKSETESISIDES